MPSEWCRLERRELLDSEGNVKVENGYKNISR